MSKPGSVESFDHPDDHFTMVSNAFTRDIAIPHTAFRVAVYVRGHAPHFRLTQASIGKALNMNRGTVAAALVKLEELGYARRIRNFSNEGRQPDSIKIGQIRRTPEEWEQALAHAGFSSVGKTSAGKPSSVRRANFKKKKDQEDQPSGRGVPPAPESSPPPEDEMPPSAALDQPGLFEAPEIEKPKRKERPKPVGSPAVVAAYVDSYVAHHGRSPLRPDLGKIGRAAKLIISKGDATEEELIKCAATMGRGEYSDLYQQLRFSRPADRGPGRMIAARRDDEDNWADLAASTAERVRELDATMQDVLA